jgi:hypothetical protein
MIGRPARQRLCQDVINSQGISREAKKKAANVARVARYFSMLKGVSTVVFDIVRKQFGRSLATATLPPMETHELEKFVQIGRTYPQVFPRASKVKGSARFERRDQVTEKTIPSLGQPGSICTGLCKVVKRRIARITPEEIVDRSGKNTP